MWIKPFFLSSKVFISTEQIVLKGTEVTWSSFPRLGFNFRLQLPCQWECDCLSMDTVHYRSNLINCRFFLNAAGSLIMFTLYHESIK